MRELDIWLYDRPVVYAQTLACRAALRVLPFLVPLDVYLPARDIPISAMSAFRGTLVCWAARAYPEHNFRDAAKLVWSGSAELIQAAAHTEWIVEGAVGVLSAHDAICQAASKVCTLAAREFGIRQKGFPSQSKLSPAQRHILKFTSDFAEAWANVEQDAAWLNANGAPDNVHAASLLVRQPLWNEHYPREIYRIWLELKAQIASFGEDWGVWIEWYERRLAGDASAFALPPELDRKFTVELATEGSGFWARPPITVNADIITRLDRARQVTVMPVAPTQSCGAPRFQITPDDRIDFASHDQDWLLEDTPRARTRYAELLKSLKRLGNLANQFDENIAELVAEFGEAVPDEIPAVDPDLFFARFNRLRRFLEGHRARVNSCRLSDDVAFALEGLRDDGNLFLAGQPKLLEIQSLLPNPVSPQVAEQRYRRIEVVLTLNAQNSQVTSPAAGTEVVRAVEDGKAAPDSPIDQAAKAQGQLTQKNYLYALIEKLVTGTRSFRGKVAEGAAKKLGEQGIESSEKFIEDMAQNSDDIVNFLKDDSQEYANWFEGFLGHWL